jgi:hypothetical protein
MTESRAATQRPWRFRRVWWRSRWAVCLILAAGAAVAVKACDLVPSVSMPGESHRGPLPELSEEEAVVAEHLRRDVEMLAGRIGQRNLWHYERLVRAAEWLEESLRGAGFDPQRQTYTVEGKAVWNIIAEVTGRTRPDQILVVGAHYDTVLGSPGANDNGSGVAATLALARRFVGRQPARTVRFVLFVNEEPPFFQTETMGSLVYARECRRRGDNIVAMFSLETIGCYSDQPGSQQYPWPLSAVYPSTGNFIAFVGNTASEPLVKQVVESFRRNARFPSEGGALPGIIPGVGWSDHWSFWQVGYPALMVTDTAPFRYAHYHTAEDTPDKLDYQRTARVVVGLDQVLDELANPQAP